MRLASIDDYAANQKTHALFTRVVSDQSFVSLLMTHTQADRYAQQTFLLSFHIKEHLSSM